MKSVNPCGLKRAAQRPRFCAQRISVTAVSMETAKRQPGHWYGLAFEPVLKGNRV